MAGRSKTLLLHTPLRALAWACAVLPCRKAIIPDRLYKGDSQRNAYVGFSNQIKRWGAWGRAARRGLYLVSLSHDRASVTADAPRPMERKLWQAALRHIEYYEARM